MKHTPKNDEELKKFRKLAQESQQIVRNKYKNDTTEDEMEENTNNDIKENHSNSNSNPNSNVNTNTNTNTNKNHIVTNNRYSRPKSPSVGNIPKHFNFNSQQHASATNIYHNTPAPPPPSVPAPPPSAPAPAPAPPPPPPSKVKNKAHSFSFATDHPNNKVAALKVRSGEDGDNSNSGNGGQTGKLNNALPLILTESETTTTPKAESRFQSNRTSKRNIPIPSYETDTDSKQKNNEKIKESMNQNISHNVHSVPNSDDDDIDETTKQNGDQNQHKKRRLSWNAMLRSNKQQPQQQTEFRKDLHENVEESANAPKQTRKPSVLARMIKAIPHRLRRKTANSGKDDQKEKENEIKVESMSSSKENTIAIGECAGSQDTRLSVMHSSCFCKDIEYELLELPEDIQHCYCSMCRKMHGAPLASWCSIREKNIRWIKGLNNLKAFKSSEHGCRFFCGRCSANVALKYDFQQDAIWLTPALFDEELINQNKEPWYDSCRVLHIFCNSRCQWYPLPEDGQPQLDQSDIIEVTTTTDEEDAPINLDLPPEQTLLSISQLPIKPVVKKV